MQATGGIAVLPVAPREGEPGGPHRVAGRQGVEGAAKALRAAGFAQSGRRLHAARRGDPPGSGSPADLARIFAHFHPICVLTCANSRTTRS